MRKIILIAFFLALGGCMSTHRAQQSVYLLFDISPSRNAEELAQARKLFDHTLAHLRPGDRFAFASLNTADFSDKEVIGTVQLDDRPGRANRQKRMFKAKMDQYMADKDKWTPYRDISGALAKATQFLKEQDTEKKRLIVFSDLKENLPKGQAATEEPAFGDLQVEVVDIATDALNQREQAEYLQRIAGWRDRIESAGGTWRESHDVETLEENSP